jgi:hypothetical protein
MKVLGMTVDEATQAMKPAVLARIKEVLEDKSIERFNPAELYRWHVENNTPVNWYEPEVAKAIADLPSARSYHEVGSSIGELALLLALTGRNAAALLAFEPRLEIGKRITSDLARRFDTLPKRLSFVLGRAPEVFDQISTKGAMCVTTNLGVKSDPAFIADFLRAVARHYSGYVFDACLLWGIRRDRDLIDSFLADVRKIMRRKPVKLFDRPKNYAEYYYVDLR